MRVSALIREGGISDNKVVFSPLVLILAALGLLSGAGAMDALAQAPPFAEQAPAAQAQPAAPQQPSAQRAAQPPAQAAAKPEAAKKPAAPAPLKHLKIRKIVISGNLRGRSESWGWFPTPGFDDNYTFGAMTLRVALSQQTKQLDWYVEGEFPLLLGLPEGAIAPGAAGQLGLGGTYFAANRQQDASAVPKQAYVRFKGIGGDSASSLRLGRFEFSEPLEVMPQNATLAALKRDRLGQRLIGPFGFSHVGRSFDGLQFMRDTAKNNFTFFGARPTEGVFQLRGTHELDVDLYYAAWTRQLTVGSSPSEARLFGIHYHDGRRLVKTDNRPKPLVPAETENIRINTVGGHWTSAVPVRGGTMDLLGWGAAQFGHWGRLTQRSGAVALEGGYEFTKSRMKPWLRAGYFWSSGDGNAADGNHNTFFQMLPTPRVYARMPIFNLMNLKDAFVEFLVKPHPKVSVRTDAHQLWLSNPADLWYAGGGAFQGGTFGISGRPSGGNTGLGTLVDFSADYTVTRYTTLSFYAGGIRGGSVPAFIYPSRGAHPGALFVYFEFVQTF